jgi:hypothetical protein
MFYPCSDCNCHDKMAGIIATAIVVYIREHELLHLLYRA